MAAPANTTTLSVDYTGRDYYAIREQLIARVQARVKDWKGDDPSDFGLAIIEAFAYMGDLVNYYIDRIANEAYILTATQRESLLNLANLFGYRAANYVSASTTLTISSQVGYLGRIGGAIIEQDFFNEVDEDPIENYCKVIVPNNNPFDPEDPEFNQIKVSGFPGSTTGVIGDTDVSYYTSVFNGTFDVAFVGYDTYGSNVVWYRPNATILDVSVRTAPITSASGDGSKITYFSENEFLSGQIVSISGFTTSSFNLSNVEINSSSATQFTVLSEVSGTAEGTGTVTDTGFTLTLQESTRKLYPLPDQKILLSGVTGTGNTFNGTWPIFSWTPATDAVGTKVHISTKDEWAAPKIAYAQVSATMFRYALWSDSSFGQGFTVGQKVTVTGVNSSANTGGTAGAGYNLVGVSVEAVKDVQAAVSRCKTTTGAATYYVSEQFAAGDIVTIRNIASASTSSGAANVGFNLSNKTVSNTTATISVGIQNVTTNGSLITYETDADPEVGHGLKVGDFVTITDVANDANTTTDRTDVLNLKSARITAIGGDGAEKTTFTVVGYWTNSYSDIQPGTPTATLYAFTITSSGVTDASGTSTGSAISKYFDLDADGTPGTWVTSANAKASVVLGGTYTSGGTIVYSNLPTVIPSGATATIVGFTTVPKGSQVSTQVTDNGAVRDIVFSTQSEATVPYQGTARVLATHGEDISLRTENAADSSEGSYDIAGELLGYSTGDASQRFSIKDVQVAPRSVRTFVDTGTEWEEWTQVEHLQDFPSDAKVFQVNVSADETVFVEFGDGISGRIPAKESGIKSVYVSGGGTIGNVAAKSLQNWRLVTGTSEATIRQSLTVTNNTAATGGTNPESNDSIRYNAPRSLRSLNRAVTLEDFAGLALSVDGVVKANAYAESRSSVTVYIAPTSDGNEETPGILVDSNTPQMDNYIALVSNYLADKKQIGTTVTVLEPSYSNIHVEITYSVLPQYNTGLVETALKSKILDEFSYDNLDFQDTITPEEMEFKLRQVDGISNVRVKELYRLGGSGRNSLIGDPYEIFVFTGDEIGLSALHGVGYADLNDVIFEPLDDAGDPVVGDVIHVPTSINAEVYSYSLVLPYGTTQLLTRVSTNDNGKSSVTINDNVATYDGTEYYEYTFTQIPSNTIGITVVAEDGLSTNSYRFKTTIATS
jgi:hypothetical protein